MLLSNRHFISAILALAIGLWLPGSVLARPDLERKIGTTIADSDSADYHFSDLRFTSADGQRHYRVRIAQPRQAPAPEGYPTVYFLDGNAVLMGLNPTLLAKLAAAKRPPVLVMIGYDNDLRIDAAGRAYDYTLPLPVGLKQPPRGGGGADAFLQLIETRIKPAIAAKLAVDPQRQTLWGHSYGGLFVLHTLFTHATAFQRYIAVEPSLWWGNGMILQEAQQMMGRRPVPVAKLQLWVGLAERDRAAPPGVKLPTLPANATRLLAEHLAQLDGLAVGYREWPALGHGAMLDATIEPALSSVIAED
ncbi:alpha/beta hydrolase [Serratia sp. Lou2A]|nr:MULTISPECIES: alpha/beta hydrolase-fold protein [Serratia]MBL5823288.1 alpha/beta hydrolase [Serratia marcescens]MCC7585897.1 alpha/beta hydrolase [Serratia sp. Lou2A]MCC7657754.1 alpha/beta hydrolase [Serratia sp. Pon4B]HEJ7120371.1 alpha/beta hydrolase [Serratia marcescens]